MSLLACLLFAAHAYHVSPKVAEQSYEAAGRVAASKARVGPMAIPVEWFPVLAKAGFPERAVRYNPCENMEAGVWILSDLQQIQKWEQPRNLPPLAARWQTVVTEASRWGHVPAALIDAVISRESGFHARAISPKGAVGLMQLMPGTAAGLGVNPYNPVSNIYGGTLLLNQLLRKFDGNLAFTLAAYNAGPKAVLRYGGIPPYRQTQQYVPAVIAEYTKLSDG